MKMQDTSKFLHPDEDFGSEAQMALVVFLSKAKAFHGLAVTVAKN